MKQNYLIISLIIVLNLACSTDSRQSGEDQLPPQEFLVSNYHLAGYVYTVRSESISAGDTLFDDSGTPGYIRYSFTALIDHIYKGRTVTGDTVIFSSVIEYNPQIEKYWKSSPFLLVFLNQKNNSDSLQAIEAGIIALTDSQKLMIENLFSRM